MCRVNFSRFSLRTIREYYYSDIFCTIVLNLTLFLFHRRHLTLFCEGSMNIFPFDQPLCTFSMESSKFNIYARCVSELTSVHDKTIIIHHQWGRVTVENAYDIAYAISARYRVMIGYKQRVRFLATLLMRVFGQVHVYWHLLTVISIVFMLRYCYAYNIVTIGRKMSSE